MGNVSAAPRCPIFFPNIRENCAGCEGSYEGDEARISSHHGVTFQGI